MRRGQGGHVAADCACVKHRGRLRSGRASQAPRHQEGKRDPVLSGNQTARVEVGHGQRCL
jgi:hypothetical protein